MNFLHLFFQDFISLIYPALCVTCEKTLSSKDRIICLNCKDKLPKTQSHLRHLPYLKERFYGRINPANIYAFLHYKRKGIVQKLFYEFKYRGNKDVAVLLGEYFGDDIKNTLDCSDERVYLVPVPLHASKVKIRGYNQSEEVCKGLANKLGLPIDTSSLIRIGKGTSQTQKSRTARWESLQATFTIVGNKLTNKHVILVDDVLTTGATLEVCYRETLKVKPKSISVLVLAITPPN